MRLYRLNVARNAAGRDIPFDRVYMAHGEGRKAVKKLFQYAIVMPMAANMQEYMAAVCPELETTYPYTGREQEKAYSKSRWLELLGSQKDWVLVVPILPRVAREVLPQYMLSRRWYTGRNAKFREKTSVLPSLAYLQTPEQNYRPVCVACPRFSEHNAGLCQPGMRVCFDTLVLGDVMPFPAESAPVGDLRESEGYSNE